MERGDGVALDAEILDVEGADDLAHEAAKGLLADQEVRVSLVPTPSCMARLSPWDLARSFFLVDVKY